MNDNLISCKTCGAEMAKSAKVCPSCGAKNKKPLYKKWWLWAILVVIIIAIVSAGKNEPKKVGEVTPTGETTQQEQSNTPEKTSFAIGDQVELNGVVVSLDSVTESEGSTFNTPADGQIFVLCQFTIENNSSKEINISSLLCFDTYCDDYSCSYSLGAQMAAGGQSGLDGTIAGGKKMVGVIGYEVAKDWKELEIHFTPDFWSNKDIVFTATH